MKRLTIIAVLFCAITAQGQFAISKGQESRDMDHERLSAATYIGTYDDQTLWVSATRRGWGLESANADMDRVLAVEVHYPHTELLAATHADDTVTLLLADRSESKRTDVALARHYADGTLRVDTVVTFAHAKKDRCLLWGAVSPSGNHIGLCAVVEYTERQAYSAVMYLFTAGGDLVFRREFALGTMDQLAVTDDGRMATLGMEQEGNVLHLIFNYADINHAETAEATVKCEQPRDMRIVNVVGNHLVAIGTVEGSGFRGAELYCGGDLALSYNLDSAKLEGFSIRPFMNEDINIFYNKPTKKVQRDPLAEHVTPLTTVAMPYGGVMATGRNFEKLSTADNGTEEHSFSRVGIHLVAVDTNGSFLWVRNLRRNDFQKGDAELLTLGLAAMGDTLLAIKSEHRKYPASYEIGKAAKQLKMGDKSNLVLYTVTADGTVEKNILEAKTKHSFLRLTPQCDIITVRGSRLRDIKLSRLQ